MILGYIRVSTDEQAKSDRTSLAEQERVIRGIAMTRGAGKFDLQLFSDPGVSGSIPLPERPAGKQLLETAAKGDVVVASKLDRMFRSAVDALQTAETFKAKGVDLILFDMGTEPVTSNGISKCFFTMLSAFAELERERIAERMEQGRRGKRERNGHLGGEPPYGYRVVGSGRNAMLVAEPTEQEVVTRIKWLANRKHTPAEIQRELARNKMVTRTGLPFQIVQIQRLAARPSPQPANQSEAMSG